MKRYLTLDGGTTNTRLRLVENGEIVDTIRIPKGARANMEEPKSLDFAVRDAISEMLARHVITECDILRILASGMVTSEFGLCALPHAIAPVGVRELHESMHEVNLSHISAIPFVFIRGVRLSGDALGSADMMRGEETELVGISDGVPNTLYVLPGSHSKLVLTDEMGRISSFCTMLTGEMIYALATSTILKDAVDLSLSSFDEEKLLDGYRYAKAHGLNEALFKVRILKNLFGECPVGCYSFFLGAVLSDEISAILSSPATRIVIGGRSQIRNATKVLLEGAGCEKEMVLLDEDAVENSTSRGMITIYEYTR
ncbi:MAG: 2-dehydro-3-deoxygalactonokinase [Clostridia bacterium]|nr:2-dehydro-3-deoxygalactonokinase [Clostridia bacterium]